ncbi:hypothetical protein [Erythrobacter sp. HI0063]|uniref:DUF6961 family protein n=1 Tax=Erythrobacter sp. HI0063 TaxID=1822240 RepID=UPI0018D47A4F|nr:hypothetical protein [Erythrobacter sp. HI0063]
MTLSVERKHGENGARYIAQRVTAFEQSGPPEAVALWRQVQRRYEQLSPTSKN